MSKTRQKKNIVFDVEFFDFWIPTWVPEPEVKFKNRVFFVILGELGPTWAKKLPQAAPGESQESQNEAKSYPKSAPTKPR